MNLLILLFNTTAYTLHEYYFIFHNLNLNFDLRKIGYF